MRLVLVALSGLIGLAACGGQMTPQQSLVPRGPDASRAQSVRVSLSIDSSLFKQLPRKAPKTSTRGNVNLSIDFSNGSKTLISAYVVKTSAYCTGSSNHVCQLTGVPVPANANVASITGTVRNLHGVTIGCVNDQAPKGVKVVVNVTTGCP